MVVVVREKSLAFVKTTTDLEEGGVRDRPVDANRLSSMPREASGVGGQRRYGHFTDFLDRLTPHATSLRAQHAGPSRCNVVQIAALLRLRA